MIAGQPGPPSQEPDRAKNASLGESKALRLWTRGLATMERAARRWAAGVIPASLSAAERSGAARRLRMAASWLLRAADNLESPVDDDAVAVAEEKAKPTYH